jgi:mannose-6-phosphate isomerase-like protein (cupin superfamily)
VVKAAVLGPGDGEHLAARGSALMFKATAATTGGAFSLHERRLRRGGARPPAHVHPEQVEAFWVLDGVAVFELDGLATTACAGSFVLVPGGLAHTFGATDDADAHVLVLHAPALDDYFRDLDRLWAAAEPPPRSEELALMRRHGLQPVDPG